MNPRNWPVYRQLTGTDRRGLGPAARSDQPRVARTTTADAVVKSICPYCAVGCGQNVYVADGKVIQIEVSGDIPVVFADYNIQNPSFAGFVTTQDHGLLEFLLVFSKA